VRFTESFLIEGLDDNGKWNKFNIYNLSFDEVKQKAADVLLRTNYVGVKIVRI